MLNHLAVWWFERTRDVAPDPIVVSPGPDAMIAHACEPSLARSSFGGTSGAGQALTTVNILGR